MTQNHSVNQTNNEQTEGLCPVCHQALKYVSKDHYQCENCKQFYLEQAYCSICSNQLKIIKGCGAINYLCNTDGLISSKKVQFHYIAENGD